MDTLERHDSEIRQLQIRQAEARGAARAAAQGASRIVALVGILGMVGQLVISGLHI